MAAKDKNIVIYYNEHYYELTPEQWQAHPLGSQLSQLAYENVISKGKQVGYIDKDLAHEQPGGYSTVLNLDAMLKGQKK